MALPLFAITLFVSAFLLFLVQPLIGKTILPRLGGTPQVWNTCMMFFQCTLLLGYFYTHATSKLSLRRQMLLHCGLLVVPLLFLLPNGPFNIQDWTPPPGSNPIWQTVFLLAYVVGVPFLVVSTSAPLLQKWFSHTGHPSARDPYFLYGASNLGSLLSLVLYPFMVEPMMELRMQAWTWTVAYVALAGLILACAYFVTMTPSFKLQAAGIPAVDPTPEAPPAPAPEPAQAPVQTAFKAGPAPGAVRSTGITRKKGVKKPVKQAQFVPTHTPAANLDTFRMREDALTWGRRLRWVLLAFAPSSLMLGVTSFVSVDLSPFPLLWVIPLALYLLSFILVFAKVPYPTAGKPYAWFFWLGSFALVGVFLYGLRWGFDWWEDIAILILIPVLVKLYYDSDLVAWVGNPHRLMLFAGAPAICILLYIMLRGGFDPFVSTMISFLGFFLVTMMCHGELAKDRPMPAHLTEYFLIMSIGGALGGIFNALLAPVIFVGVAEYPIAIAVAAFMRPKERSDGWFDELVVSAFPGVGTWFRDTGDSVAASFSQPPPRNHWLLNVMLDFLFAAFVYGLTLFVLARMTQGTIESVLKFLGVTPTQQSISRVSTLFAYGPSLIVCLLVGFNRGLRFGLCVTALLLAYSNSGGREGDLVYKGRSYFGVLRVYTDWDSGAKLGDPDFRVEGNLGGHTHLMHGTTYHGRNFHYPEQLRRLATTYYHRKGPVGDIMERYNWGANEASGGTKESKAWKQNTYYADVRLPISMIGLGATPLGVGSFPVDQITAAWSEPPIATIGLGTGTMASYGRWLQHVTYYEIDESIRNFSLPPNDDFVLKDFVVPLTSGELAGKKGINDPYFTYLVDAIRRGVNLEVVMGDARQSMSREKPSATSLYGLPTDDNLWPSTKYPMYSKHPYTNTDFAKRENYYKVIVVDAFSSDAIPIHLITEEAIAMYMSKLAPDGVLCVHTSNRHMQLIDPVADIAVKLNLGQIVGHDTDFTHAPPPFLGLFGSEYIMLANDQKFLPKASKIDYRNDWPHTWIIHSPPNRRVWTDSYTNIVSILR